MKQLFVLIFSIFSSILLGCSSHQPKAQFDQETKVMKMFLKESFDQQIPLEKHYYFLIPSTQCRGCNYYSGDSLNPDFNKNLTVVSSFPLTNFDGFNNLKEDTSGLLNRMAFLNFINKLVVTDSGKVVDVLMVSNLSKQIDSLNRIAKH